MFISPTLPKSTQPILAAQALNGSRLSGQERHAITGEEPDLTKAREVARMILSGDAV